MRNPSNHIDPETVAQAIVTGLAISTVFHATIKSYKPEATEPADKPGFHIPTNPPKQEPIPGDTYLNPNIKLI